MRSASFLGLVVLVLVIAALFSALYVASDMVGKAFSFAEAKQDIVRCSPAQPCERGVCVEGYCRNGKT